MHANLSDISSMGLALTVPHRATLPQGFSCKQWVGEFLSVEMGEL